jgi:hypothetical protein
MLEKKETFRQDLEDTYKRHLQALEDSTPLFEIAQEYADLWSPNQGSDHWLNNERASDLNFAKGFGTINCLALNLRLGPTDTITLDIKPIIEALTVRVLGDTEYLLAGWKGWNFGHLKTHQPFLVRVFFEQSTRCKVVEGKVIISHEKP